MDDLRHRYVDLGDVALHVAEAGPPDGRLIILLHGFPEFWYGWRGQIPALSEAGLRVWAPDQRGYNLSDKPRGVGAYRLERLAADVLGLIKAAGQERAAVVGHDWGAAVAWAVALLYPDQVERLGILNVPHPQVMLQTVRHDLRQLLRSWYILFFQIPRLPEALLRAGNWRAAAAALQRSSRPGTFSDRDLDAYRQAWSQPGAFDCMLNWYRAAVRYGSGLPPNGLVRVPTLMLWGVDDVALSRDMAQQSIDLCENGRLVLFEGETHWLQHEEPDRVNRLLVDFLSQG